MDQNFKKLLDQMKIHDEENKILQEAEKIKQSRGIKKTLSEGIFTSYYETGMEGTWGMCIQEKKHITPNPNYKKEDPNSGPENFHSMAGLFFIDSGDFVVVKDPKGNTVYEGMLTKNRKLMTEKSFNYSFLPNEVEFETFIQWIKEEYNVIFYVERK